MYMSTIINCLQSSIIIQANYYVLFLDVHLAQPTRTVSQTAMVTMGCCLCVSHEAQVQYAKFLLLLQAVTALMGHNQWHKMGCYSPIQQ